MSTDPTPRGSGASPNGETANVVELDPLHTATTAEVVAAIECLSPDFGDPETLLNSRQWLEQALTAKGAKFLGGGCGFGAADIDIELEGCQFNVTIRPILRPEPTKENAA